LDDYNELILAPDISSWDLWFNSGSVSLYMYMTEFIARSITAADMSEKTPLYSQ
jgi:ATP-binding cassette subfamily A (ABC1) protein 3